MNAKSSSLSPELLKANQRLHELRQLAQLNRTETGLAKQNPQPADSLPWEEAAQEDQVSILDAVSQLPSHLGWGSKPASLAFRAAINQHHPEPCSVEDKQLRADHPSSRSISDGSYSGGQPLGESQNYGKSNYLLSFS
ncbi:MAG: hypothetical protein R6X34_12545 [Chloroflexota bacterium]